MQFSQHIEIGRGSAAVWALLEDIPQVVQCVPGAELLEASEPGIYRGRVTSRLGPITTTFEGEGQLETDQELRMGTLTGSGKDRKTNSRARATIAYRLVEFDHGTRIEVDADIHLSGTAAQFGRPGLVREIAARLMQEFAQNVEARIKDEAEASGEDAQNGAVEAPQRSGLLIASLWSWLLGGLRKLLSKGDRT